MCTSNEEMYEKFIVELQRDFVLSTHGKLEWYLGCKIIQDMENGTVSINQEKCANDVLRRFNIQEVKPVSTPYETGLHLTGDDYPSNGERDPEGIRDYQECEDLDLSVSAHSWGLLSYYQSDSVLSE